MHPNVIKIRVSTRDTSNPTTGIMHMITAPPGDSAMPDKLRRVSQQFLQQLRNQHGARIQHEPEKKHRHRRQREIAVLQHPQIDHRVFFAQFPDNSRHDADQHQHEKATMKLDENQSSRSPLSRMICMLPSPRLISPIPM